MGKIVFLFFKLCNTLLKPVGIKKKDWKIHNTVDSLPEVVPSHLDNSLNEAA